MLLNKRRVKYSDEEKPKLPFKFWCEKSVCWLPPQVCYARWQRKEEECTKCRQRELTVAKWFPRRGGSWENINPKIKKEAEVLIVEAKRYIASKPTTKILKRRRIA